MGHQAAISSALHFARQRLGRHPGALVVLAVALLGGVGLQLVPPLLVRDYLQNVSTTATTNTPVLLAGGFIAVSLLVQVITVFEGYVAEKLAWAVTNELRVDVTRHCLELDMGFHTTHLPGELVERVDGDVSVLSNFMSRFIFSVLGQLLLLVGLLAALVGVDWRIGLSLVPYTCLSLFVLRRLAARGRRSFTSFRAAAAALSGFFAERLAAVPDIKGNGAVPHTLRELDAANARVARTELSAGMWGSIVLWATASFLAWSGTAIALLWCWDRFDNGHMTVATVFLVFTYSQQMMAPLDRMAFQTQDYQAAVACVMRLRELLELPVAVDPQAGAALPAGPVRLELESVTFAYASGPPVLREVSLAVEPGRSVGVVGRTGSGKSTLARLVARLYEPSGGRVLFAGHNGADLRLAAVRHRVALVPQEVQLVNGTVRDNVTFFDDSVPDSALAAAFERLGLRAWVDALPRGLDTVLGAGGSELSAGEEQLISLARVLLRDPDVVVLDEASARLDPFTERLLDDAVAGLLRDRTGVVIAHRLSTLRSVDDIAVMDAGRIVEYGARDALARTASRYAQLLQAAAPAVDDGFAPPMATTR